jgi:choline dehydrogenase
MNGRRVYHARGKVLGGSSSINGMIFQRGNPMDYERWAGDQGMEKLGLRPLPARTSRRWRRASRAPTSGAAATARLVLERGPATSPLFQAFFKACVEAGYPLTKDVNGYQQEGFAPFDRNIHNGRRYSAGRGLPAPGHGPPEPRRPHGCAGQQGPVRRHAGDRAWSTRSSAGAAARTSRPTR